MTDDGRDERGRYTAEFSEEEFLEAVRENQPAGTSEVADAVGCTTQNADYRLRKLHEEGRVEKKMVGNSLVWTPVDEG